MKFNRVLVILVVFNIFCNQSVYPQGWLWGRVGSVKPSNAWAVATDKSGSVYAAGVTDDGYGTAGISFGSGITSPIGTGLYKTFWIKYSSTGTPIWSGGTMSGDTWLNNITTDSAGNLIVFGYFVSATMKLGSFTLTNPYPYGTAQFFLAKINPSGTVLWAINDGKCVNYHFLMFNGLAKISGMGGVTTDHAGNIYIISSYNSATMSIGSVTLTNSASGTDEIFVAKYTPAGTLAWASSIGGTEADYGLSITVASNGNVYVCGAFSSNAISLGASVLVNTTGNPLAYIAKLSPAGLPIWGQAAGSAFGAYASGLAHDNYGNVFMTGGVTGNSIAFGHTSLTRSLPTLSSQLALYLVQYSPSDTVTWCKSICSASRGVCGYGVAMASCGQVWVNGSYSQAADIEGYTLAVVSDGAMFPDPLFIAGYDLYGTAVRYAGLSSGGDNQSGIACDNTGNVFVCADNVRAGTIVGPDTFGTPPAFGSIYVAKYNNAVLPDTNFVSHSISICNTDSVTLHINHRFLNYYWNNGSGDSILRVGATGTYWVCATSCDDTVRVDTFHVVSIPVDTVYNKTDIAFCRGFGDSLKGASGYSGYLWNTGTMLNTIYADTTGMYYVIAVATCSLRVDTFHVAYKSEDTSYVSKEVHICNTPTGKILSATPGYAAYIWNTGASSSDISVSSSGKYIVNCSNPCVLLIQNFEVHLYDSVKVDFDYSIDFYCDKDTATFINTSENATRYIWLFDDGGVDSSVNLKHIFYPVKDTTWRTVILQGYNPGCNSDTVSKQILLYPVAPDKFLNINTADQAITYGKSIQLGAEGAWIYYWLPDDGTLDNRNINNPVATPLKKTIYTVYGYKHLGCLDSATVTIDVIIDDPLVPSAFSPNGDGINDVFQMYNSLHIRLVDFSIYNRWGECVFNTINLSKGWDGKYKGVPQETGVYFYMIIVARPNGENRIYKGDLTLIR